MPNAKCSMLLIKAGSSRFSILSDIWNDNLAPHRKPSCSLLSEVALRHDADFEDWSDSVSSKLFLRTPLHALAATSGTLSPILKEEIQYLLNQGFAINARDDNGWSPFLHMVYYTLGFSETAPRIHIWAAAGADINVSDNQGRNAFHILAKKYQYELSLCSDWRDLETSLNMAAECIQALLDAGCDAYHIDRRGRSPSVYMRHFCTEKLWHIWISKLEVAQLITTENLDHNDIGACVCIFGRRTTLIVFY